ncbi:MAG TPA: helix-turn-helix transcriptional regulator [Pyrinomonadaceae bacterium]|nr:helix-turn-helix transcriptional regulator [Pyrinomonadaceae bacterium]
MMETDSLRKIIGKQIKHYRELLKMSQQDLGMLCGLRRSYIGSVERGERNITIDNIERIAKGLGLSPDRLLRSDPPSCTSED